MQRRIVLADPQLNRHSCAGVPQPLQIVDQPVGRLITAVRLLLEQVHDDL
jgi:hypothetical protein